MKEPKSFKHPRVYMVDTRYSDFYRMRIIFPNGEARWLEEHEDSTWEEMEGGNENSMVTACCWASTYDYQNSGVIFKYKTGEEALVAMREYDRRMSFKTIFIGEIK